jgi:hypothetical protein
MLVLYWVLESCGFYVDTNVSEKHAVSTFRDEVTDLGSRGLIYWFEENLGKVKNQREGV